MDHLLLSKHFGNDSINIYIPSFAVSGLLTTYCLTSSSFDKLKSFLILLALLGPRRRGTVLSVTPGISWSPFFNLKKEDNIRSNHYRVRQNYTDRLSGTEGMGPDGPGKPLTIEFTFQVFNQCLSVTFQEGQVWKTCKYITWIYICAKSKKNK